MEAPFESCTVKPGAALRASRGVMAADTPAIRTIPTNIRCSMNSSILSQDLNDLVLVLALARNADVAGGDLAIAIDQQSFGKRLHTAVILRQGFVPQRDSVADSLCIHVRPHRLPAVIIHGNSQHRKPPVLVSALEI